MGDENNKEKISDNITKEHLERYLEISTKALSKAIISSPERTHLHKASEDVKDMVKRYLDDAGHFMESGDYVRALSAINYAHGWLDCAARLGLFDVGHDSELFTVD